MVFGFHAQAGFVGPATCSFFVKPFVLFIILADKCDIWLHSMLLSGVLRLEFNREGFFFFYSFHYKMSHRAIIEDELVFYWALL